MSWVLEKQCFLILLEIYDRAVAGFVICAQWSVFVLAVLSATSLKATCKVCAGWSPD